MTYINIEEQKKRKKSYLGRIPSVDFCDEVYQLFLECATSEELEEDILVQKTLDKLNKSLGFH